MKVVNIMLEEQEHERLKEAKGSRTWKEALIDGCEVKDDGS